MSLFRLAAIALFAALATIFASTQAHAQARIVEWVQSGPASDPNTIALGYPVPVPVDTPLPFAGFRTYAGLHMRHQDLAQTTPWAHPHQVGITRSGRTVWAYRLGDDDLVTPYGKREQAMLSNGGIHAREWQSPEVATGIIELLTTAPPDDHLISYLRENANIIVIPVLNVDGFMQTQRYPSLNWLGTDPGSPEFSPRDGRMRRKNMLGVDEIIDTQADHLSGIDLNRNNDPFWATSNSSSGDPDSLVYHGTQAASEPETRALDVAAALGPADQLSMYTDMHSFSQVLLWVRNSNNRQALLTQRLLQTFSDHHIAFPAAKWYAYNSAANVPRTGIGTTEEYFTFTYEVPSWTLEIEPTNGQPYHAPHPGSGADYGGLGRNGHDGFILPESEVPRVRTELAQTFAVAYYQQSGPPALTAMKVVDDATDAVVFEAEWDAVSDTERTLHTFQAQSIQLGREYRIWMAHDKPMRWREGGEVVPLQGQPDSSLDIDLIATVGGEELVGDVLNFAWLDQPAFAADGYARYRDDAFSMNVSLPANDANLSLVEGETMMQVETAVRDMTNVRSDAEPATVARWENGAWAGYEDDNGSTTSDLGGHSVVPLQVTDEPLGDPFVLQGGTSAAWFDPDRAGEGFVLEALPDGRVVMYWFTYDAEGHQDWYIAVGEIRGNQALFPELLQVSGGEFGPDFDPEAITETVVGSATFTWSGCDIGVMKWQVGNETGRMNLARLSTLMGAQCGDVIEPPLLEEARRSGSWYDPDHAGEGYTLEVLIDQRLLVYWFGFGPDGARRWFFGIGEINGDVFEFDDMLTTTGGVFGADFDPESVELLPWGTLDVELNCESGEARFVPSEPGFPPGTLDLIRLTFLDGLEC